MIHDRQITYWAHMLDECMADKTIVERAALTMILNDMIVPESVKEWSVFSDEKISRILKKAFAQKQALNEDEAIPGDQWRKMPFWQKLKDYIVSGKNYDGSDKGWFEDRKFPTITIKDEDMTAANIINAMRRGYNVLRDSSTASPEQQIAATKLLSKAFDANFTAEYDKLMSDIGDVAGGAAAAVGYVKDGATGAATAGTATKAAVTKYSDNVVQQFNNNVKNTEYENLTITQEDLNRSWFEQLVLIIMNHPYISMAAVITFMLIYKNRTWIWDRLKLGFNNLWQGKIIAKCEFELVDNTPLSFEYDLRFNKWRLLYRKFQWSGDAYPDESAIASFMKTRVCREFIDKCGKGLAMWIEHEKEIREIVQAGKDPESAEAAETILKVLDDLDDIKTTFTQLKYKVG